MSGYGCARGSEGYDPTVEEGQTAQHTSCDGLYYLDSPTMEWTKGSQTLLHFNRLPSFSLGSSIEFVCFFFVFNRDPLENTGTEMKRSSRVEVYLLVSFFIGINCITSV